jgi:hypothetical protein
MSNDKWVSVPVEPTEAMLRALQKAQGDHSDFEDWLEFECGDAQREWTAMLAAAPKPAEGGDNDKSVNVQVYWSGLYRMWRCESPDMSTQACGETVRECLLDWLDKRYPAPPPAAQAAGASMEPVAWRARSLVWEPDGPNWCDPNHGFYITDSEKDDGILLDGERAFRAAWGEGEVYGFDTLDEAKAWCQQELQRWLDENIEPATSIPLTAPVAAISAGDVAETRVTPEMLADAFQMDRAGGRYYLTEYGQDASNGPMRGVVFYDAAAIKDVAALLTAALRRCTCCPGSDVCAARQRSNT